MSGGQLYLLYLDKFCFQNSDKSNFFIYPNLYNLYNQTNYLSDFICTVKVKIKYIRTTVCKNLNSRVV